MPCSSERMRSWTVHDIATYTWDLSVAGWGQPKVVVSRTGTATVAWTGADFVIRTLDEPPGSGEPQDPAHGSAVDVFFARFSDFLGIDAADGQTLVYQAESAKGGMSHGDLVFSERVPGHGWSSSTKVEHRPIGMGAQLAVNASGAAVVMWSEETRRGEPLFASYRSAADAGWTSPERVPAPDAFEFDADIDDAGRVLLVYDRIYEKHSGVLAIRRTPAGRWGKTQRLSGLNTEWFSTALGAGGAAVVTYGHVDGDGRSDGPQFTSRMSPSGTWGAPVRQPDGLGVVGMRPADVDAKGRALLTGWQGADLIGRWGRPNGRWGKPFVVAGEVSKSRMLEVAVNRRGDALVAWGAKGRVKQVWALYKPAGQEWTQPVRVTGPDDPPRWFSVAIGECGHVAIAWTTLNNNRQIQVRRASPMP